MNGAEKAAALIMSLGEEVAGEIMKNLKSTEITKITSTMVKLDQVKNEQIEEVTQDFLEIFSEHSVLGVDGGQYMQNVLANSLGEEKANEMMESLMMHTGEEGMEAIRMMEPRMIADIIKREHPQVISFVLAALDPVKSSQVLENLPEEIYSEVIYRVSTMSDIHPNVLNELEQAMKEHISENAGGGVFTLGGIKFAAELINRMDSKESKKIMDEIQKIEEPIYQKIEEQLFTFEDIAKLDDRAMQAILKEVNSDIIVLSLRGAEDVMMDKFFKNMSERAVAIIKEEMELQGPVRVSDVEAAHMEMVKVVKALEEAGTIVLAGGGEDEFV